MIDMQIMRKNLENVKKNTVCAAFRASRRPEDISLVAVTKTVGLEEIRALYDLGVRDFGENRLQVALPKIEALQGLSIRWHMIGRMQTNKATKIAAAFDAVHSVDSVHLAEALDKGAKATGKRLKVFVQVNVSCETSKTGFAVEELLPAMQKLLVLPNLQISGLMTMAPITEDPEQLRPIFRELRVLRDQCAALPNGHFIQHLSMGMTQDYIIAIEEGATHIRVGTALFES